jgi:hypothetical protein
MDAKVIKYEQGARMKVRSRDLPLEFPHISVVPVLAAEAIATVG